VGGTHPRVEKKSPKGWGEHKIIAGNVLTLEEQHRLTTWELENSAVLLRKEAGQATWKTKRGEKNENVSFLQRRKMNWYAKNRGHRRPAIRTLSYIS